MSISVTITCDYEPKHCTAELHGVSNNSSTKELASYITRLSWSIRGDKHYCHRHRPEESQAQMKAILGIGPQHGQPSYEFILPPKEEGN